MPDSNVDFFVKLLLDKTAAIADRDDAAMDLGLCDDDTALKALIQIAIDPEEHEMILSSCGESIADIWLARGIYSREVMDSLTAEARREVYIDPESLKETP